MTGTARAGQAVGATPRAYTGRSSWASVRLSRHRPSITIPATPRRSASVANSSPATACSSWPATTRTSPGPASCSPASIGIRSSRASTVSARPTSRSAWSDRPQRRPAAPAAGRRRRPPARWYRSGPVARARRAGLRGVASTCTHLKRFSFTTVGVSGRREQRGRPALVELGDDHPGADRSLRHRGERGGQLIQADASADARLRVELAGGDPGEHGRVRVGRHAVAAPDLELLGDRPGQVQPRKGGVADQQTDLDVAAALAQRGVRGLCRLGRAEGVDRDVGAADQTSRLREGRGRPGAQAFGRLRARRRTGRPRPRALRPTARSGSPRALRRRSRTRSASRPPPAGPG